MGSRVALLAVLCLLVAAAGCGGSKHDAASTTTTARKPVVTARQKHELVLLRRDVRLIRVAAAPITHETLKGTPALQKATGRFLDDLDHSSLTNLMKNRQIDFAASAVAGSCDQCFQMLEAARPIPAIAGY